jgi:hypothetical protein
VWPGSGRGGSPVNFGIWAAIHKSIETKSGLFPGLKQEAFAAFNGTCIGDAAREAARGIEVVFHESATLQGAFDNSTVGERRSQEDAVNEFAIDEIDLRKKGVVPLDILKRARHKVGGYDSAFLAEAFESTVLEMIFLPRYGLRILVSDFFREHFLTAPSKRMIRKWKEL